MKNFLLVAGLCITPFFLNAQTTYTVTNSGFTFTPDTVNAVVGDAVNFTLGNQHNVVEVSQATWSSNGNTSNGGFSLGFGGGTVNLTSAGTFYYVCQPHASMGMKGVIIVTAANGVEETKSDISVSIYPTVAIDFVQVNLNDNTGNFKVEILDLSGKIIRNSSMVGGLNHRMDVSAFSPGIYFMRISDGDRIRTLKFVKQ